MECIEWDGRGLDAERIALAVPVAAPTDGDEPTPILAAAFAGDVFRLIRPRDLGPFLRSHPLVRLVCADAARLHWALDAELRRLGDEGAIRTLWDYSRQGRLDDVVLLDQLVELGRSGLERPARRLRAIARDHGFQGLPDDAAIGRYLAPYAGGGRWPPNPVALDGVIRSIGALLPIEAALRAEANRLAVAAGIDPEADEEDGLLTLALQVRGAIALGRLDRSGGLLVGREPADALRDRCEALYLECSQILQANPAARECFSWAPTKGEKVVRRDGLGLPIQNRKQLVPWLDRVVATSRDHHGLPLRAPRTTHGQFSSSSHYWGDVARRERYLWAWARLEMAADTLSLPLDGGAPAGARRIRPRYDVLPRIRSRSPDLEMLTWARVSLPLEAPPDRQLLICKLDNLELRCLANASELAEGQGDAPETVLGQVFAGGMDPAGYAAEELRQISEYFAGLSRGLGVDELRRADPPACDRLIGIVRIILEGVPRGLGGEHIRELVRGDFGVDMPASQVQEVHRNLFVLIFPELRHFKRDPLWAILREELGDPAPEVMARSFIKSYEQRATLYVVIRDVLAGRRPLPDEMRWLLEAFPDEGFARLVERCRADRAAYDRLFRRATASGFGRVRGGLEPVQAVAEDHLDSADDIRKEVLYALVADGREVAAISGDEIVVLVPDRIRGASLEAAVVEIRDRVESVTRPYLWMIPARCDVEIRSSWGARSLGIPWQLMGSPYRHRASC